MQLYEKTGNDMTTPIFAPDITKPAFLYRFEMYVPVLDNSGQLIDIDKFETVNSELLETFGGVSYMYPYGGSGGLSGVWLSPLTGLTYQDKSAIFIIYAKQDNASLAFFSRKRRGWEKCFDQEGIWITVQATQTL